MRTYSPAVLATFASLSAAQFIPAAITTTNPLGATYEAVLQDKKTTGIRGTVTATSNSNGTGVNFNVNLYGFPDEATLGPFSKSSLISINLSTWTSSNPPQTQAPTLIHHHSLPHPRLPPRPNRKLHHRPRPSRPLPARRKTPLRRHPASNLPGRRPLRQARQHHHRRLHRIVPRPLHQHPARARQLLREPQSSRPQQQRNKAELR